MRISVNGTRIDSNTGKYIDPALWNQSKERAKGTSKNAIDVNDYIDETNIKLFKLFQEMQSEGVVATAQELHNRFFNIGVHKVVERMIITTFQEHNQECRALMGRDFELGTIKKYETITRLLQRYIKKKYEVDDLPLTSLDRDFVHGFEMYLKIDRNQQQNTVARYMKGLKKITNRALANDWITKDPFAGIKVRTVQTNPTFLTLDELHIIYRRHFDGVLDVVRDMFVMAAFTGLAFIDISNLKREHVVEDNDGNMWIRKPRQKTDIVQNIPLLDIPKAILKKYEDNQKAAEKGTLSTLQSGNEPLPERDRKHLRDRQGADHSRCPPHLCDSMPVTGSTYRECLEDARTHKHQDDPALRPGTRFLNHGGYAEYP